VPRASRDILPGMTRPPGAVPLRPDYSAARSRPADTLIKAATARLLSFARRKTLAEILAEHYPENRQVAALTRAASLPASTTGSGWADTLAQTSTPDFLMTLGPQSAGATVLGRCISFQFGRDAAAIKVPSITSASANATFVAENAPIPVRQLQFDAGVTLAPKMFATIAPFTREVFDYSLPTIESTVRAVMTESVGAALDAALFSNTAGDATRPPGLLVGLSPVTPTASGDWAMIGDIEALAASIAPVAGNAPILFVASPKQMARMRYSAQLRDVEIYASSALADKTVLCIATNCVASAIDPAPRFDIADQTALHMSTTPSQLVSGTGPVVASPITSLYQVDALALKMILQVGWGLRSATGLAFMSAVNW
jgi:hypothetical protein